VAGLAALAVAVPVTVAVAQPGGSPLGQRDDAREGVTASVTPSGATLSDSRITRVWSIGSDGSVETTSLLAGNPQSPVGKQWAAPGPDFNLDVDGVSTSSTLGWSLISVTAQDPPTLPDRPTSATGNALLFRYSLVSAAVAAAGIELDRLLVLHPGSAVIETTSTLIDHGPVPIRVSSYSLDQIVAASPALPAEVQAYNGGSDWRDDYRHVSSPTGAFDAEGEVARFGTDAGYFLVSQRRGGVMSRAGRDSTGRSYVGVDWARDLFDWGPLMTSGPTYNRQDNPAYPVPVRARVLQPLGSLNLGTSYLGVFEGGPQQAAAEFAADFAGAQEPSFPRSVDINSFHPWGHGDGMSDLNLRHQVDVAKDLGVENFMLDDQWQGGTGGESGDWQFDPARFPTSPGHDVPDFVDYVHAKGLNLALWMSPMEFNMASQTYMAHPDWACAPVGDATAQVQDDAGLGVWDATNPAFQAYIEGVVHRLTAAYGVVEFKFDFMTWVDCAPHDYADYEDAFVKILHDMQAQNPGVTFELDETNDQRAWPFESAQIGPAWFDNGHLHGSTAVAKLLHDVWSAAPWVPTWSIGAGVYDGTLDDFAGDSGVDFLYPLAMLTHATFWTDLTKLTDGQKSETAWWTGWYQRHRDELGPAVYELTSTDPLDGKAVAAWQPWSGGQGYVFAFNQSTDPAAPSLSLQHVDSARTYVLKNVRTADLIGTFTGAQLAAGLPITLPGKSAVVLSVTPQA
jgi:hypothetical protein